MLGRLIYKWEERLNARDRDQRVSLPFDWGLEYLGIEPSADPVNAIDSFNGRVLKSSEHFFAPSPVGAADFDFDGSRLHFPSGILSPYQVNNTVHARFFESPGSDRAVIVSPQWNADAESHVAVCRLLNRAGVSALRLSLPYHDRRMPEERSRADFMVSANIGRTIQAVRQAVQDVRRAADWLIGARDQARRCPGDKHRFLRLVARPYTRLTPRSWSAQSGLELFRRCRLARYDDEACPEQPRGASDSR